MKLSVPFLFVLFFAFFSKVNAQAVLSVDERLKPFYHGVASGDPLQNSVIIWTRITPEDLTQSEVNVTWSVATDKEMNTVIKTGTFTTNPTVDFTVKVDVTGLTPNTFYYYQFEDEKGMKSIIGRTKTAPDNIDYNARFAMISCANLEYGYFNGYGLINEKNDVDAVLCLGDYIYEYEQNGYAPVSGAVRHWEPKTEITTLADYRNRYSSYRLDKDLRRNHQLFPWICIWDDHESADNSYRDGAKNHTEGKEGKWENRKEYAKQAYFEWIPIRPVPNASDPYQIYRDITYGKNIDLIMLDTRLEGRDYEKKANNKDKKLISDTQKNWMENKLKNSTRKWKFLVQQVMMAQLPILELNTDQWAGYKEQRKKIRELNIDNLVVLTGDIHSSWAIDLTESWSSVKANYKPWGVEIVTPSITAPGAGILGIITTPYLKYKNGDKHGFVLLDIDSKRVQADWYHLKTIAEKSTEYTVASSWKTLDGTKRLSNDKGKLRPAPSPTRLTDIPKPNPVFQNATATVDGVSKKLKVLSLFPNPADDFFTIQYNVPENGTLKLDLINTEGKIVKTFTGLKTDAVWTERYPTSDIANGMYIVSIKINNFSTQHKLLIQH